ncbi:MAG: alpha/beta fold hydrolase [Rhodococcus sp.]|nr:alpha/beta fold hydrolase [Rhodococcus sp. (in: high G+C Gram-positive bacteria)]
MTPPAAAGTSTETPLWMAEVRANQRAMPLQRLIGSGMDYADVVELYALAESGVPWELAGEQLGDRNLERGRIAERAGHFLSAQQWYLFASACYRAGQVPLPDGEPKLRLYRKLIDTFGDAGELADPAWEHLEIPFGDSALCGWLMLPHTLAPPPVVIVVGGFDGWREEYAVGAQALLDRGIACLLLDGPGQGETRLFRGMHMNTHFTDAYSAVIDHLMKEPRVSDRIGLCGNSLGGYLAARAAATEPRIDACCVNGGTIRPAELPERHPRFIAKVQALYGIPDCDAAFRMTEEATLQESDLALLRCPLLVLHGTPDQVFLVENARALYDGAGSTDKTWLEWPDGDHCIYNHTAEKHTLVGDWFADRLGPEKSL